MIVLHVLLTPLLVGHIYFALVNVTTREHLHWMMSHRGPGRWPLPGSSHWARYRHKPNIWQPHRTFSATIMQSYFSPYGKYLCAPCTCCVVNTLPRCQHTRKHSSPCGTYLSGSTVSICSYAIFDRGPWRNCRNFWRGNRDEVTQESLTNAYDGCL